MKIAVAGSTGLIGTFLCRALLKDGHEVIKLVRQAQAVSSQSFFWDPLAHLLDPQVLTGVEVVINLTGETINGYWNESKKHNIRQSRLLPTHLLVHAIAQQATPPRLLINASATGYVGARGDEVLFEPSEEPSKGFLAEVCDAWEKAMLPAHKMGVKCIALRFGAVLTTEGGALKELLTPFKMGMGGKLGSGDQMMNWIAIDDAIKGILYLLNQSDCEGAYNFVSPDVLSNQEFTQSLGKALNRPTALTMPAFLARLTFGQLADELLLNSTSVYPKRLLACGYTFSYPSLKDALKHLLQKI